MALILDHVNGDAVDNRLENLRFVCANCYATLETHCGRTKPCGRPARDCDQCGGSFRPTHADQRFCSRECGSRFNAPARRTVRRPTVGALLTAIDSGGYLEAGRRFGVSDNAIRKWLRWEGVDPPPGAAGVRHPPPVRRALTDEQAITALALIAGGASDRSVAEKLGTSRWCVRDLRRGRSYRHLPRPAPDATPAPSTMPP
jgi:hypothetical protein